MTPADQAKGIVLALTAIAGNQKTLSKGAHISDATLTRRIQSPEDISMGELTRLCRYASTLGVKVSIDVQIHM